jgi:UDP-glucose 4-epimerase
MKVVVTGASGFVGHRVVKKLLKLGVETCAVARRPVEFSDSVIVDSYFDTPVGDILIHLAENPNRSEVNEIGSAYAVEAQALTKELISKGYQRIVFTSSVVVYGDKIKEQHKTTDCVFSEDVYAKSKLACESLIQQNKGIIARMSNLYGPGMSDENVFSKILNQIPCTNSVKVWNDKSVRDFLWIDDAVDALVKMALGTAEGIYNVASGTAISINELTNTVLRASSLDNKCKIDVTKPTNKESAIVLDISETSNMFDWEPHMSLEDGIKQLLNNKK